MQYLKAFLEACRLFLRQCKLFFWMAAEHVHRRYLKQDNFDRHGTLFLWSETPTKYVAGKREKEKITLDTVGDGGGGGGWWCSGANCGV